MIDFIEKTYALYFCPGTLFAETDQRLLETGTIEEACRIAKNIEVRHGARPYGFDIITKLVSSPIDDGRGGTMEVQPKEIKRQGRYYLGGTLIKYDEVDPTSTMVFNMKGECLFAIEIVNRYKSVQFFRQQDSIVDPETGAITRQGTDEDVAEYFKYKMAEWGKPVT
jgi:hypothetical protein